jgi:DNA-binding NarL/FixJ family response regulator
MRGDEERIRDGGCDAYLSEPISVPKFIETIRRFLEVGQSMPAVSRSRQAERRRRNSYLSRFFSQGTRSNHSSL